MANTASLGYAPQDRTPPGDTLAETLEALGMTQTELSERVGLSRKTVNQIIRGVAPVTAETAVKLETALGTPAAFWLNLDANYQEFLARQAQQQQFQANVAWLQRVPYQEMAEKRWLPACDDAVATVHAALSYFGMASPARWEAYWTKFAVRFHRSKLADYELGTVASWLRKGELDAHKIQTESFNARKFQAALRHIRALTKEDPEGFQPKMRDLCAAAGVALVFTPGLKGLRVSGATYWLTKDKALIQLSLCCKSDDQLWFTFFHESRHVLQEIRNGVFVEGLEQGDDDEADANAFAADFLIPKNQYAAFLRAGDYRARNVTWFAGGLDIAPGILVGRLQRDKAIGLDRLNGLKRRFRWATQP